MLYKYREDLKSTSYTIIGFRYRICIRDITFSVFEHLTYYSIRNSIQLMGRQKNISLNFYRIN